MSTIYGLLLIFVPILMLLAAIIEMGMLSSIIVRWCVDFFTAFIPNVFRVIKETTWSFIDYISYLLRKAKSNKDRDEYYKE